MSEHQRNKEDRKARLKELLKRLHRGEDPEKVKENFKEFLKDVTPAELSQAEEALINEGMSREELQRLCDVHIALLKESLEKGKTLAPAGHPIHILMEEHKILLQFTDKLKNISSVIKGAKGFDSLTEEVKQLNSIAEHFKESEKHYLREENVLFPYLEKHGITQPPAIMWSEHQDIREKKKELYQLLEEHQNIDFDHFADTFEQVAKAIADKLSNHFYKENNILFPTALKVISQEEWGDIRKAFDEIGYCCFTPEYAIEVGREEEMPALEKSAMAGGKISFETGAMSVEELETILNSLPVDITFVDKEDRVGYFSQSKDRIFVRSKAVIVRKVQQCHPQKSLPVVEQILKDFKEKKRDVAEFWINLNERLIYIRYFPVRNKKGEYLGCLEVTQDITDIKKIEGEKRLLES